MNYSGSYTVRNTPEVIAPNVVGGNPCAVGASGGLALPGFGFSAGTTWADKACELRQKVALMFNMGEQAIAREMLCQDDEGVRAAMQRLGKPCGVDMRAVSETRTPQVAQAQAPAPPQPAPPVSIPASMQVAAAAAPAAKVVQVAATEPRPEWCGRASPATEASRDYFQRVCGR
ncbi:MAG: hypothetical protein P4L71_06300 [Acetobacteraceae bacterium]|nr:hypothetical protein [Acetobacteraceae bacterium]